MPARKKAEKPWYERGPWTLFWDMHSGGGLKEEPYEEIYIEAPQAEAEVIFYNRFSHDPHYVTCDCCGPDYAVDEDKDFLQASGYHRKCKWTKDGYVEKPSNAKEQFLTPDQYASKPDVLIIKKEDITPQERVGTLPRGRWEWVED